MPKQIKLTDRVAAKLEERAKADGLSLAGEVDKLLTEVAIEGGGGTLDSVVGRLDYLEGYLDKRLSKLESLIEDTTVDRVSNSGGRVYRQARTPIDWEVTKEIFYALLRDGGPEWVSESIRSAIGNLNDPLDCYVEDNYFCSDDAYGTKRKILNVTPRLREFLASKGVVI